MHWRAHSGAAGACTFCGCCCGWHSGCMVRRHGLLASSKLAGLDPVGCLLTACRLRLPLPLLPPAASSSGRAMTRTSCLWACLLCCRPSRLGSRWRSRWPSCAGKAVRGPARGLLRLLAKHLLSAQCCEFIVSQLNKLYCNGCPVCSGPLAQDPVVQAALSAVSASAGWMGMDGVPAFSHISNGASIASSLYEH